MNEISMGNLMGMSSFKPPKISPVREQILLFIKIMRNCKETPSVHSGRNDSTVVKCEFLSLFIFKSETYLATV